VLSCTTRPWMAAAAAFCAGFIDGPIVARWTSTPRAVSSAESVSAYVKTPPTASVVIRTRSPRTALLPRRSGMMPSFELCDWPWLVVLDVAERRELAEIVSMGSLPCVVLTGPEAQRVLGRPRVGEERYWIVGPDAGFLEALPPRLDIFCSIARRIEEVRL